MAEYFVGDPSRILDQQTYDLLKADVEMGYATQNTYNGMVIQAYQSTHAFSHSLYDKSGKELGTVSTDPNGILAVILLSACHKEPSMPPFTTINSAREPFLKHSDSDGIRIFFDDNIARVGQ